MRSLQIFVDLTAGRVALVGSGNAALNMPWLLRADGARVRRYPADAGVADAARCEPGSNDTEFTAADPLTARLDGLTATVSTAGEPMDGLVAARTRAERIPINAVDRAALGCAFGTAQNKLRSAA